MLAFIEAARAFAVLSRRCLAMRVMVRAALQFDLIALRATSASRSCRTFASVRLRSTAAPLSTADHLMPGHWPVASSIFARTTRKPCVLSAAANSAADICGGALPRAFFI
jgi:hypothetical protein